MKLDQQDILSNLDAKCLAFELLLSDLLFQVWPLEEHRAERYRNMISIIERSIREGNFDSTDQVRLEKVKVFIDSLFGSAGLVQGSSFRPANDHDES